MSKSTISMKSASATSAKSTARQQRRVRVAAHVLHVAFIQSDEINALWTENRHDRDYVRCMTRPFYDAAHGLSTSTGLITRTAFEKCQKGNGYTPTKDHCYRPQTVAQFMLDNREMFQDFAVFLEWFTMLTSTILVDAKENNKLSLNGIDNRGSEYIIKVTTDQQYVKAGLDLFAYSDDRSWKKRTITPASNLIEVPGNLLDWERSKSPKS
jgi:hypothetical protein